MLETVLKENKKKEEYSYRAPLTTEIQKQLPHSICPQRNEFFGNHHLQHVSGNMFCPSLLERHQNLSDLLY